MLCTAVPRVYIQCAPGFRSASVQPSGLIDHACGDYICWCQSSQLALIFRLFFSFASFALFSNNVFWVWATQQGLWSDWLYYLYTDYIYTYICAVPVRFLPAGECFFVNLVTHDGPYFFHPSRENASVYTLDIRIPYRLERRFSAVQSTSPPPILAISYTSIEAIFISSGSICLGSDSFWIRITAVTANHIGSMLGRNVQQIKKNWK